MQDEVTLRPLCPEDGPAMEALGEQTPETGAIGFHSCYEYDPYASLLALDPGMAGIVAEAPGHDGIAGMALLSAGECWYEGKVRPSAYLYTLSVHPAYRRRGIGRRLSLALVALARARGGDDAVIYAGVQAGNQASLATATSWISQRVDGRGSGAIARMRRRPPRPLDGITVRPAETNEFEEIAAKQNAFYREYNFYPPQTAGTLSAWQADAPFGYPLHTYFVAVDRAGPGGPNIVAGLGVTEEGRVMTNHIKRLPWPMRAANLALRLLPADGVIRRVPVRGLWYAPGRAEAGRYLWESIRWLCRDRGTMLMCFFDPLSPVARAVRMPRLIPSSGGSLILTAPVPLNPGRYIYHPA